MSGAEYANLIASYVAMSRIHDNRHYLSDVVFGAAVGAIAGRTVVHHKSDYWAFSPVAKDSISTAATPHPSRPARRPMAPL